MVAISPNSYIAGAVRDLPWTDVGGLYRFELESNTFRMTYTLHIHLYNIHMQVCMHTLHSYIITEIHGIKIETYALIVAEPQYFTSATSIKTLQLGGG